MAPGGWGTGVGIESEGFIFIAICGIAGELDEIKMKLRTFDGEQVVY